MAVNIVGGGALGRLVANILRCQGREISGFYDDDEGKIGSTIAGIPVRGPIDAIHQSDSSSSVVVGIGDVQTRKELYEELDAEGFQFATAIHPSASIASSATVGAGTIVKEGAVIEVSAQIGVNAIVGNGAVICHDTTIGAHARLAPSVSIAGHSTVGAECYLAVDVSVDRRRSVGARSIVASGCTIWRDIPEESIVKLPNSMKVEER